MKAIVALLIGILVWALFGHFFPPHFIFITPLYIPLLFMAVGRLFAKSINLYVYLSICFASTLLNDILYRFFGGGDNDRLGRDLCEISFYATLSITTISLFIFVLVLKNRAQKTQLQTMISKSLWSDILSVLGRAIVTLAIFILVNRILYPFII